MALRRVLPSRAAPEKSPESAAVAASAPETPAVKSTPKQSDTPASAPSSAPEESFGSAPAPSDFVPAQAQSSAMAAAATSAFSTLPGSAPARVLEDSFAPAPQPEPVAEPAPAFVAPAWDTPATPAEPAPVFTAPAWETPAAEEAKPQEPAFVAPAWESAAAAEPVKSSEPEFVAPAWESAAAPVATPAVQAAPMPAVEPVIEPAAEAPAFVAPAWEAPAEPVAAPVAPIWETAAAPQPEPQPAPVAAAEPDADEPAGETLSFEPSRPDSNRKRRVREKRPRDFTAMGAPEVKDERPKPTTAFAASVPVNTKTLDKVDEDLIASGIVAPPPPDSLTGSLPSGAAESEAPFFVPEPQPEPQPVAVAPAPEPAPVALPEPQSIPVAVTVPVAPIAAPQPPVAAPLPPLPEPQPEPLRVEPPVLPEPGLEATPEEPMATPSFNLSNTPAPSAAPLPPPQSDLPWTQSQSAAEWEIETPQQDAWMTESAHDAAASTPAAAHMPPPAQDLYKSMGNGSAPILPNMGSVPPRSNPVFTPELPSSRRKQAGTPWALIAVGAVVAVGAGAYYIRSGGDAQQAQQQLANLTKPSQQQAAGTGPDGMLLPPHTDNVAFYTPPAPASSPTDVSSSAIVNFADVPASEANQPIVATGDEKLPDDTSFFGKVGQEVARIKAEQNGVPADASATTAAALPSPAAVDAAATRQSLNDELAAYRSALAQSPNPAALTPSAFKRDPDGYMDGKPQTTDGTPVGASDVSGTAMSSGSLLPPPELYTNNPKNLPVVAEPIANAPQRVRTLSDFPDVEPYMPEREKVEVPKNLKPKMAATDFPALEVLSFVPGKGIVAFADGREGVLLIGETLNGWELVNVSPDNAEFKAGQKSYQVTAEN